MTRLKLQEQHYRTQHLLHLHLLTTESVVANIKEDVPAVPAGNPGHGNDVITGKKRINGMDSTGIYGHEKTADRTVCRFLCPQIIKCTLREHSIIMNKRKLWGCPKTSLLILNEYLTEQTCKQSVVVLRIHDAKPDVLVV